MTNSTVSCAAIIDSSVDYLTTPGCCEITNQPDCNENTFILNARGTLNSNGMPTCKLQEALADNHFETPLGQMALVKNLEDFLQPPTDSGMQCKTLALAQDQLKKRDHAGMAKTASSAKRAVRTMAEVVADEKAKATKANKAAAAAAPKPKPKVETKAAALASETAHPAMVAAQNLERHDEQRRISELEEEVRKLRSEVGRLKGEAKVSIGALQA